MQIQKIFRDSRGSNLVESALVFGAFIFMVIGAFDFGQAVFMHQSMVERVRAAARFASVTPTASDDNIRNLVVYGQTTIPADPSTLGSFCTNAAAGANPVSVTRTATSTPDVNLAVISVSNCSFNLFSPYVGGLFTMQPISVGYTQ
jgi:Flp pilus assembly protein TadG